MGGTRFVGKALVKNLKAKNHELILFTRGNNPFPEDICHIPGDRNTQDIEKLKGMKFDVIVGSFCTDCHRWILASLFVGVEYLKRGFSEFFVS